MNVSVFTDFMSAMERDIDRQRRARDRHAPFREFVDALDRDREARKVGKRDPYFEHPAFDLLKGEQ